MRDFMNRDYLLQVRINKAEKEKLNKEFEEYLKARAEQKRVGYYKTTYTLSDFIRNKLKGNI